MTTHIKKISYIAIVFVLLLTACKPQEDVKPDLGLVPVISSSDYSIEIVGSKVIFNFLADQVTPILYVDSKTIHTNRIDTLSFEWKGTYSVVLKEYNKAGISKDSVIIPLEIPSNDPAITSNENYQNLTGGSSKTWVWDKNTSGHLGCGESGLNWPNWYSAAPLAKDGMGLYDDELTFVLDNPTKVATYILNSGTGVFVNTSAATTMDPVTYPTAPSADVLIPYTQPKQNWVITTEGGVNYMTFTNAGFPSYVCNPAGIGGKYIILSLTATELYLQMKCSGINWYFKFIPK